MGQAIARGENEVVLECPAFLEGAGKLPNYDGWINEMARRFDVIRIVPTDPDLPRKAAEFLQNFLIPTSIGNVSPIYNGASPPIDPSRPACRQTFHEALDAYAMYLKEAYLAAPVEGQEPRLTGWGNFQVKCCDRFKERHEDFTLAELDHDKVESLQRFWANRPPVKGTIRPLSVDSAEDHVKQIRSFFSWPAQIQVRLAKARRLPRDQSPSQVNRSGNRRQGTTVTSGYLRLGRTQGSLSVCHASGAGIAVAGTELWLWCSRERIDPA